jgi:hypothetical protein
VTGIAPLVGFGQEMVAAALLLVIVELNADSRWSGSIYSREFPVGHLTMPSLIFLLCCGVTFLT